LSFIFFFFFPLFFFPCYPDLLASQWIDEHPEYHAELADVDAALAAMLDVNPARDNPFFASLHALVHQRAMQH